MCHAGRFVNPLFVCVRIRTRHNLCLKAEISADTNSGGGRGEGWQKEEVEEERRHEGTVIEGEQLPGHILLSPAGEADSSRQEVSEQAQVNGQKGKGEDLTRGR